MSEMEVSVENYNSRVDECLLDLIKDPEMQEHEYAHNLLLELLLLHQTSKKMKNPILTSCVDCLVTIGGTAPQKLGLALVSLIDVIALKEKK